MVFINARFNASRNNCNSEAVYFTLDSRNTGVETTAIEDSVQSKSHLMNNEPWTRQEDMFLLQSIKREYSENSFLLISEKLKNRTIDQVIFLTFENSYISHIIHINDQYILGEREMSNFALFTRENVIKMCIYTTYIYVYIVHLRLHI